MALHGARMSNANAIPEEEATAAVLSIWDTKILRVKKPQAILALRDCDLYTKNRDLAQAVLMILEHELKSSRGRGGAGFSNWDGSCTVEHILPQDPSKWLRPAGLWTKPEHRDCLHKLGNLCLLNQSDNSKVRNKGYREKVAILQGAHGVIASSGTAQTLQNIATWDLAAYQKRHKELLCRLVKRWRIDVDVLNQGPATDGEYQPLQVSPLSALKGSRLCRQPLLQILHLLQPFQWTFIVHHHSGPAVHSSLYPWGMGHALAA